MAAAAPLFPNLPSPGSHALQLAPSPGAGSQPVMMIFHGGEHQMV